MPIEDIGAYNPPQAPEATPTSGFSLGQLFSNIGGVFGSPQPSPTAAPPPTPEPSMWETVRPLLQSGTQGFLFGANPALALQMQRQQIAQQEEARRAQETKMRMGQQLLEGFTSLLNVPPNISGPAWDAFVKAGGYDPKDPNVALLGKTFGKLDPEQREAFKQYLSLVGSQNPDQVVDVVQGLTRNPASMLKLMGDIAQFSEQQQSQRILSGEAFGGQPTQAPMPEQLSGPPPEQGTLGQMIQPQPQAPVMPPPPPTLEQQSSILGENINQLNAVISALDNQRAAIAQNVKNPTVRKSALDEINTRTTAIRTRINSLEQQRQNIFSQQREENAQKRFETNQERLEKESIERDRRSMEIQDRIDARAKDYHKAIVDRMFQRPLEQNDRDAIGAMEENLRVAQKLRDGFTPQERAKFVGILRMPAQQAAQFFRDKNSPEATRFSAFRTLTNEVKGFAFAEGGKQLTNTEKAITWGHLPVGNEFSVSDYLANLDRTIERTNDLINRRIELATSPRSRIQPRFTTPSGSSTSGAPKNAAEYLKKFNAPTQ